MLELDFSLDFSTDFVDAAFSKLEGADGAAEAEADEGKSDFSLDDEDCDVGLRSGGGAAVVGD